MRLLILFLAILRVAFCFLPPPVVPPSDRANCLSQPPLICNLASRSDRNITGTILFTPVFRFGRVSGTRKPLCLVRLSFNVTGLTSVQAVHIHTFGDLSSPVFLSLGGHFKSPFDDLDKPDEIHDMHGYPFSKKRHWGDFGNLNSNGTYIRTRVDRVISLGGIVGRGIVVHEGRDQGPKAQPSGGAGSRTAGCVIGFANPTSLS